MMLCMVVVNLNQWNSDLKVTLSHKHFCPKHLSYSALEVTIWPMARWPGHTVASIQWPPKKSEISLREPFSFDEDTQKVKLLHCSIGCRRIIIERRFLDFRYAKKSTGTNGASHV